MTLGSIGAVVYDVVARDKTKEGLESAGARAKNMNKTALMVGAGMTAVGVGAKLMADNINKTYLSFDSAMAEVKSLGGVTVEQMAIMRSSAIGISKELPLSATNVARGFYMMRSAGFEAGRVIEELPAIAEMAVAGNLEMADAVNSVTMVLDTYGERAGTAADITNVLMGTVQGFKTTLPELQMQLSKNVGVAASLGIEFHELAAMSGMLKKEFVNAEEAGTGMKTMLLRLVDPKVQAQLEGMGVEVKDANGDFIGMQAVLDSLSLTLQSAGGDVEQMAILQKLFGAEGVRAAMSLIRQKDSLAAFSEQVNAGVSVQEALNAVLESTQSQLTIAENKMDAARIQLGEGMAPATIFAANTMALFAGIIEGMPGPLQSLTGSAIIAGQSLIAIGPAIAGIAPLIIYLKAAHAGAAIAAKAHTIATHAQTAAQWLMNASLYACPLTWIVLAIGGVIAILYILERKFGVVTDAVKLLSGAIHAIIGFFGNVADAIRGVVVDTDKLTDANERLVVATEAVKEAEEEVAIAEEKAAESAEDLAEASAELAAVQLEVSKSAREVETLTEAYEELKGAMNAVADITENLDDLDRNLRGAQLDLSEAQDKYNKLLTGGGKNSKSAQRAQEKYTKAVNKHSADSEEAREAQEKYNRAVSENVPTQNEVARAALRVEGAIDRVDDIKKKIIETTEEQITVDREAVKMQKKYGDQSVSDMKTVLDAKYEEGVEYFANLETAQINFDNASKEHEWNEEDVARWKEVLDQSVKDAEDIAAEKQVILEGEVVATESLMGRMKSTIESKWKEILGVIVPPIGLNLVGKKIIDTIVSGIRSKKGEIDAAVEESFDEAGDNMPHSDAKKGPFKDLSKSGKSVVTTFAKGIDSAKGSVGESFGESVESSSFSKASIGGSSESTGGNTYGGDSISIGNVSLSGDYDFPALMRDIENYQSQKRVQRGIRTL